ncbi:hypothetical protein BH23ACT10_BH23ACT10_05010 [soil metagenome]
MEHRGASRERLRYGARETEVLRTGEDEPAWVRPLIDLVLQVVQQLGYLLDLVDDHTIGMTCEKPSWVLTHLCADIQWLEAIRDASETLADSPSARCGRTRYRRWAGVRVHKAEWRQIQVVDLPESNWRPPPCKPGGRGRARSRSAQLAAFAAVWVRVFVVLWVQDRVQGRDLRRWRCLEVVRSTSARRAVWPGNACSTRRSPIAARRPASRLHDRRPRTRSRPTTRA